MEWQTIDTAPKDGTQILLYQADGMDWNDKTPMPFGVGLWQGWGDGYGQWAGQYDAIPLLKEPTHWMPLPEPPETTRR